MDEVDTLFIPSKATLRSYKQKTRAELIAERQEQRQQKALLLRRTAILHVRKQLQGYFADGVASPFKLSIRNIPDQIVEKIEAKLEGADHTVEYKIARTELDRDGNPVEIKDGFMYINWVDEEV